MPKTMLIKANPGLRIPLPDAPYRYVEGDKPIAVDVSTYPHLEYWTRRIAHGECVEAKAEDVDLDDLGATTTLAPAPKVAPPSPFSTPAPEVTEPEANIVKPSDGSKQGA